MGIFSKFENKMEDTFEGAADVMSNGPIAPVQIFKKAEKQMKRNIMVGAGKEFSPTLYTVLINADDDRRMFGYYPTLAGEAETYLENRAIQEGLIMDGHPLVRFVVDDKLRHGKFDVIAEMVAAPIVTQLRQEEMVRYGLAEQPQMAVGQAAGERPFANDAWGAYGQSAQAASQPEPQPSVPVQPQQKPPLPYVPEEEIDRSIDYGEYTFNSEDFEDYQQKNSQPIEERGSMPISDGLAPAPVAPAQEAAVQQQSQRSVYQPQRQRGAVQPDIAPNTVVYADSQRSAAPDPRSVRARVIDVAYRRAYDLAGSHITIGRESSNDITVQDINASRKHAELRLTTQGVWTVTDLGSTNGTIVNGQRIATQPLRAGDIITIGKTDLEFTLL